jgi:transposase
VSRQFIPSDTHHGGRPDCQMKFKLLQLNRKDKALAETAALLVLSKKLAAIFHDGEDA